METILPLDLWKKFAPFLNPLEMSEQETIPFIEVYQPKTNKSWVGFGQMEANGLTSIGLFVQVHPATMVQLIVASLSRIMHGFMTPVRENIFPFVRFQPN